MMRYFLVCIFLCLYQIDEIDGKFCKEIITSCAENSDCLEAYNKLDLICEVKEERCALKFINLVTCGKYKDWLMNDDMFGMTNTCILKDENDFLEEKINKIYSNPCFRAIEFLRNNNQMPKEKQKNDSFIEENEKEKDIRTEVSTEHSNNNNISPLDGQPKKLKLGTKKEDEKLLPLLISILVLILVISGVVVYLFYGSWKIKGRSTSTQLLMI